MVSTPRGSPNVASQNPNTRQLPSWGPVAMSLQQRLSKNFLSLASSRPCRAFSIHRDPFLLSFQSQSYFLRHSSSASPSTSSLAGLPESVVKNIKPDTTRVANNPSKGKLRRAVVRTRKSAVKREIYNVHVSGAPTSPQYSNFGRWNKAEDDEIVRLFNSGAYWANIDTALGRPYSSCYHRYYSALDPNLHTAWSLPNGQPNMTLLKRLAYLVEVEKLSFAHIDKWGLMEEPWQTPTPYAPLEVLNAALEAGLPIPSPPSDIPKKVQNHTLSGKKRSREDIGPFNKMALQKKYRGYKLLLDKNALHVNKILLHRAIRRSVEVYGENWKKVAEHADILLDHWTLTQAATDTAVSSAGAPNDVPERGRMTPHRASSIYRILERRGVNWGLEDDAVMTRKVLEIMQTQPRVLDILSRPLPVFEQGDIHDQDQQADPTEQPDSEHEQSDAQLQQKYWSDISIALGNHSPGQCKRRWGGLWSLRDEDKSAQSKTWHRLERFQFWILWKHFYQQHRRRTSISTPYELTTHGSQEQEFAAIKDLEKACGELSFAHEISPWLRHRSAASCDKLFKSTVDSALRLGFNAGAMKEKRRLPRTGKESTQSSKSLDFDQGQEARGDMEPELAPKFLSKASFSDAILHQVAEPTLQKTSLESEDSSRADLRQQMVRTDWTLDRIQTLQEIVIKMKQGIRRADFEVNWSKVARDMEIMFSTPLNSDHATVAPLGTALDTEHHTQHPVFTAKQCESCWEYISSTSAALASSSDLPPTGLVGETRRKKITEGRDDDLSDWSDHELQLLLQGVRKLGNSWTDIRAQFLPNKNASDLYQTWLSISVPGEDDIKSGGSDSNNEETLMRNNVAAAANTATSSRRAKIDLTSEPDYLSLLSALDMVRRNSEDGSGKE